MKIFLITFAFLLLSVSCGTMFKPDTYVYQWQCPVEFESLSQAEYWIYDHIKNETDLIGDYWQTPQETYLNRYGDCEDQALLFMYFAERLGKKTELVIIDIGDSDHALVLCEGKYYDLPWRNRLTKPSDKKGYVRTIKIMSYSDAMYCAEKHHGAGAY